MDVSIDLETYPSPPEDGHRPHPPMAQNQRDNDETGKSSPPFLLSWALEIICYLLGLGSFAGWSISLQYLFFFI